MSRSQIIGAFGENLAKKYLQNKGYVIIGQNVRIGHREIDIIANISKITIFVEVKTRYNVLIDEAIAEMYGQKTEDLISAMMGYITVHKLDPEMTRLDLVAIALDNIKKTAKIRHYKNIF